MIANRGETKSDKLQNGTLNGVRFNIYLLAAAANTAISVSDLSPEDITLKVELKRNKQVHVICQDNLMVLGLFSAKNYGINDWYKGNVMNYPAAGVKSDMFVSLFVPFGGPINCKDDDELVTTLVVGRTTFGVALDQAASYVEFNNNLSIGVERGTPQIFTQVVQANITKERYSLGDGVAKIFFLNFDIDNVSQQVINSLNLSSDKLQTSLNMYDLFNIDHNILNTPHTEYRYGNTQPVTGGNEALPYLPKYPQTFCLYAWTAGHFDLLNNCFVDISYNGGFVNASQNYVCAVRFLLTAATAARAGKMIAKHVEDNHDHVMPATSAN